MEFWKGLIEIVTFFWPGRKVEQWEKGGLYRSGRWVRELKPGIYWIFPWFWDVQTVNTTESIVSTGRLDLTMKDDTVISVNVTATVVVGDPYKALNCVDGYQETAQEALQAAVADQLAVEEVSSFKSRSRAALLKRIQAAVQSRLAEYGITVGEVSVISAVYNVRTHRLLIDQQSAAAY